MSVTAHRVYTTSRSADICDVCGESKNPIMARFERRRLGLDEPPESVLCLKKIAKPICILTGHNQHRRKSGPNGGRSRDDRTERKRTRVCYTGTLQKCTRYKESSLY